MVQMEQLTMSTKRELLNNFKQKYKLATTRKDKTKIINTFVATTGYDRKYIISVFNKHDL